MSIGCGHVTVEGLAKSCQDLKLPVSIVVALQNVMVAKALLFLNNNSVCTVRYTYVLYKYLLCRQRTTLHPISYNHQNSFTSTLSLEEEGLFR